MAEMDVLRQCRKLRKSGDFDAAMALLRTALLAGEIPPDKINAAGRLIGAICNADGGPYVTSRVRLLGQCTTSWLVPALRVAAWREGALIGVDEGEYDNVIQEVAALTDPIDIVVLLPWAQRLIAADDRSANQRVDDELAFWNTVWAMAGERGCRIVQVGYDAMDPGPMGYCLSAGMDGIIDVVRRTNDALREAMPAGTYFVDLEQVAGWIGRERFYDIRGYHWTKQPFSAEGTECVGRHLWAGVRAVTTGPKKVLVLDLDNTLWGGVVGETGPLGIQLGDSPDGEAFRAFQKHVKSLSDRGIVLAVASKNNDADAREPFETNPDMVLSLSDFAAFSATWDPKAATIRQMAETLRLGLDSFVFFDDNPAEREQVRQAAPEVAVVDVPADPADYVRALQQSLYFEAATVTAADHTRAAQYRAEGQRRTVQQTAGSLDDYLASLEMKADIRAITEADMQRIEQLLGKTNQFNLTTRRHSRQDVSAILSRTKSIGLTLRLTDRFGDYGLISLVLGDPVVHRNRPALRLDTWLMSCRAIGRTVETCLLNRIAAEAAGLGYEMLIGEFIPTAKNSLVADMYERFGFTGGDPVDGIHQYMLDLTTHTPTDTAVTIVHNDDPLDEVTT